MMNYIKYMLHQLSAYNFVAIHMERIMWQKLQNIVKIQTLIFQIRYDKIIWCDTNIFVHQFTTSLRKDMASFDFKMILNN